jgi:RHH-type transcriptional regulator, proline utilization regulon repressor / proline dehydrogenase / delta 1-pyrroline-5-carboxylate dehydrogenase
LNPKEQNLSAILSTPPASPPTTELWSAIGDAFLADEMETVNALIPRALLAADQTTRINEAAAKLVAAVRQEQATTSGTMQSFLHQYDLSSPEGVLLMCVAEALLRIPDAATADRLIRDKFSKGDWEHHLGASKDWLVNAGTWGLMLSGKITRLDHAGEDISDAFSRLGARISEPVLRLAVRQAMKIMAEQFVMGRNIEEALTRGKEDQPYRHSFDMLGEAALTFHDAQRYFDAYMAAIKAIGAARDAKHSFFEAQGISVKLSALYPRYEIAQRESVLIALTPKLRALALEASRANINLTVDAEEAERLTLSLEIFEQVFRDSGLHGWEGFGLAVQAYQKRAWPTVQWLAALARDVGRRIPVRLVKGAYWDTEIKRAQQAGLSGYPVFTRKAATDVSYLACVNSLLEARDAFYPQFATHNAHTVAYILERVGDRRDFEFQRLHGMGAALYEQVVGGKDIACRVYAPVGSHSDLLPYLVRRLLENGANASFVNRIADANLPVEKVVADPVAILQAMESKPDPRIPLPIHLYGESRANSKGMSFADEKAVGLLLAAMQSKLDGARWTAAPIVNAQDVDGKPRPLTDPSNRLRVIGSVVEADGASIKAALAESHAAAPSWNATPAEKRAAILEKAADLLEARKPEFMALCVREAGKTLPDALGEVREAVDFLRYYASEARRLFAAPLELPGPTGEKNTLALRGRGVFACISPWNFPLAIYLGQIGAALAAGNTVIAKPAEQTPLIAYAAARLLLEAGLPNGAIAFLPGDGATVGAALTADSRIAGVCFTGSTDTAKLIQRSLAARDGAVVPLIAETGGLNAMIADSSSLPEQLVQDVLTSAFNSAGQRCSALRVLLVQEEIASRVCQLIAGAMETLKLGDPGQLSTDIGPVIDEASLAVLRWHEDKLAREAKLIGNAPSSSHLANGLFFAPCAYEIPSFDWLTGEVFGPILHIVKYREADLEKVVDAINAKGYGLTLGIHSRIDETINRIVSRARVGNIYVNRNIVGAVVGTQPFGGEGLSGTGPKAGGPHYLLRFATECTLTINTAAAGGNATLMAMKSD